jgi:DNA-binding response OmpR family regulator
LHELSFTLITQLLTVMHILLVEDDNQVGSFVEIGLSQAGFVVDWVHDDHEARIALKKNSYTLVVLEIGESVSEIALLAELRDAGSSIPVLLLSLISTAPNIVKCLESGADDYLVKPFELSELIARCRALVRRSQKWTRDLKRYRNLTIDIAAQSVRRDGKAIALTAREWSLFMHLLAHQGVPQPRSRLEANVFGRQAEIGSNAIEVHVSKLRKKLGVDVIQTIRGFWISYGADVIQR